MNQSSKSLSEAAVASSGLSLLSEATAIRDGGGRNRLNRGRPTRTKNIPVRFRDSQPESSTAPSASIRTSQAPTKRKSSSRKSPPELLAEPSKQNSRTTKTNSQSIEFDTSAPNQASFEIETTYRRLVEVESQPNNSFGEEQRIEIDEGGQFMGV